MDEYGACIGLEIRQDAIAVAMPGREDGMYRAY